MPGEPFTFIMDPRELHKDEVRERAAKSFGDASQPALDHLFQSQDPFMAIVLFQTMDGLVHWTSRSFSVEHDGEINHKRVTFDLENLQAAGQRAKHVASSKTVASFLGRGKGL